MLIAADGYLVLRSSTSLVGGKWEVLSLIHINNEFNVIIVVPLCPQIPTENTIMSKMLVLIRFALLIMSLVG